MHLRVDQEVYNHVAELAEKNNQTITDVVTRMILEDKQYSDLKKSLRWTNDTMEMVYEMVNYITLEMEYRLGKNYPPRFTSDEKSRIIERIEAKRKQERGYLNARDRNQE